MEKIWELLMLSSLSLVCRCQVEVGQVYRFKSINYRNRFIRHRNFDVWIDQRNVHAQLYEKDSSFVIVPGLAGKGISLRSLNYPNRYLRHRRWYCYIDEGNNSELFKQDATFLPVKGLAVTSMDSVSFQSTRYPGFYIRHSGINARYRVQMTKDDGSKQYKYDATWIPVYARSTTLTVCEEDKSNNIVQLSCPYNNEEIFVINATYGRTTDNIYCGGADGGGVANCRSPVAENIVKKRCNGKKRCSVEANSYLFGNPCDGVSKYLQVTYTCITAVVPTTLRACEGETDNKVKITCHHENERIHITSADYGRRKTTICPKGRNDFTKCHQFLAERKARELCDGKRQCELEATNSMFGDPCPGISKYLVVSYRCEYSSRPIKLHVCERAFNPILTVKCSSANKEIRILDVFYGRRSSTMCFDEAAVAMRSCEGWGGARGLVKSLCEGKRECDVDASSEKFQEHCQRVAKYLEITYECVKAGTKNCLRKCDDSMTSFVCGTDKRTYNNKCLFSNRKCEDKTLQVLHEGECRELISSQSFHMLPSRTTISFMGRGSLLPIQYGVGRMTLVTPTEGNEKVIEWENGWEEGRRGRRVEVMTDPHQWLGWRSRSFAHRIIRVCLWIRFVRTVPMLGDVVIKVFGREYYDPFERCQDQDRWCYVDTTLPCGAYLGDDRITLNFANVKMKQKIQVKKMRLEVQERVLSTVYAMSSPLTKIMGVRTSFPQSQGVGRMYAGGIIDEKFKAEEVFTWENTQGDPGEFQWIGWQSDMFANQTLKISFWIKFIKQVPVRSDLFGVKVYGIVYNEFVQYCHVPDRWCYVEKTVESLDTRNSDHVTLTFESIEHKQLIHVAKMKVEVLQSAREIHNLLPSEDRKIMKYFNRFPAQSGVGKMFVGNVTETTFYSKDVISWQNEIGKSGVLQWLGWQDEGFSNQMLRISFWIMFVDSVPQSGVTEEQYRNGGFGIKVYGTVYNEFARTCDADTWCYVEEVMRCRTSGDGYRLILIFDSIAQKQTIRIAHLSLEIV